MNIFVQRFRRLGRRFRFAFVRFSSLKAASTTVKHLDGLRVGNASLFVSMAKPSFKDEMDFGAKVSGHRSAIGKSDSGLGAPS